MLPSFHKGKIVIGVVTALGAIFAGSQLTGRPTPNLLGNPGQIAVHVSGQVAHPGLYRLAPGSRVDDAIKAAGGAVAGDTNQLNLAALLKDGQKITVPSPGQVSVQPAIKDDNPTAKPEPVGKISLSNATEEELQQLLGVGPATVAKIVEYRTAHGGFHSIDEIKRVGGIGDKKFEKLQPYLAP